MSYEEFTTIPNINLTTVKLYYASYHRFLRMRGNSFDQLILDPEGSYATINQQHYKPSTIRIYMISICMAIENIESFKKRIPPEIVRKWKELTEIAKALDHNDQEKRNNPRNITVTYEDLLNAVNNKANPLETRLLIGLYTLIPPIRFDYYEMRIIRDKSENVCDHFNNLFLYPDQPAYIELNNYKTKGLYGKKTIPIPDQLLILIKKYVGDKKPYLFTTNGSGNTKPYAKSTFFLFMKNHTLAALGRSLGVCDFRHIYITHFDKIKLPIEQKVALAGEMGHSYICQKKYIWKDEEDEHNDSDETMMNKQQAIHTK